jgi:hypothetical protein
MCFAGREGRFAKPNSVRVFAGLAGSFRAQRSWSIATPYFFSRETRSLACAHVDNLLRTRRSPKSCGHSFVHHRMSFHDGRSLVVRNTSSVAFLKSSRFASGGASSILSYSSGKPGRGPWEKFSPGHKTISQGFQRPLRAPSKQPTRLKRPKKSPSLARVAS